MFSTAFLPTVPPPPPHPPPPPPSPVLIPCRTGVFSDPHVIVSLLGRDISCTSIASLKKDHAPDNSIMDMMYTMLQITQPLEYDESRRLVFIPFHITQRLVHQILLLCTWAYMKPTPKVRALRYLHETVQQIVRSVTDVSTNQCHMHRVL